MVRALLAGTKTQTRRVVKWRKVSPGLNLGFTGLSASMFSTGAVLQSRRGDGAWEERCDVTPCPYGRPADRLWVRESHWWFKDEPDHETGYYPPALTAEDVTYRADGDDGRKVWRPSIHMPRWASRILLEVTDVRVERLQDISEADAAAEGVKNCGSYWQPSDDINCPCAFAYGAYKVLWESINGPGSWEANPWVWAITFRRLDAV